MFASIEKCANFGETTFYKKKSEKVFGKPTLCNSEFAECEIWHCPKNLVPTCYVLGKAFEASMAVFITLLLLL
jgi:hypothetical protein